MNFVEAIKVCFQKYVGFGGRASRSEYWWFMLFLVICNVVLSAISQTVSGLFALATLLPWVAVSVRRLHDVNRSGFWLIAPAVGVALFFAGMTYDISLLSYIGGAAMIGLNVALFVFYCLRGTDGDNRFGPSPLLTVEKATQPA